MSDVKVGDVVEHKDTKCTVSRIEKLTNHTEVTLRKPTGKLHGYASPKDIIPYGDKLIWNHE